MEQIESIEDRGAGEIAARVLQRVRAVFSRAVAVGFREFNPASELRNQLRPRVKNNQKALSPNELPEFLRALDAYRGHRATQLGLRLIILTLSRTGEVRNASWSEFDCENAVWTIPAERMKSRQEHRVPLSRQSLTTIGELRKLSGHSRWLIPGRLESKPVSENTMIYAIYRMGFHSRTTVHGFRALASTILNEAILESAGDTYRMWSVDAVERALAHIERNQVRSAYDRGDRFEERKKLMQWWADYLESTKAPHL